MARIFKFRNTFIPFLAGREVCLPYICMLSSSPIKLMSLFSLSGSVSGAATMAVPFFPLFHILFFHKRDIKVRGRSDEMGRGWDGDGGGGCRRNKIKGVESQKALMNNV